MSDSETTTPAAHDGPAETDSAHDAAAQSLLNDVAQLSPKVDVYVHAERLRAVGDRVPDNIPDKRFVKISVARVTELCR